MNTWVLVADSRRARLFEAGQQFDQLKELQDFTQPRGPGHPDHPVGEGDPRPRALGRMSSARHGVLQDTDPKEHDTRVFARYLARYLYRNFSDHQFDDLVLVAPPQFLGMLRSSLDDKVGQAVRRSLDKDVANVPVGELENYLAATLH